jgi:hypothetical protein
MDDRGNMEAVQLGQLGPVVSGRRTTLVHKRSLLSLPSDTERPKLYVIVTPPEVRARWLRWVAIRQSAILTFLITFGLIAAMSLI